ncbi:hypothetical protein D9M71_520320 [compost metagenome]
MREKGTGADIQPVAAEHVGVVHQRQARLLQLVAGGVGRCGGRFLLGRGDQQAGFLHRQRGLHRADIFCQQVTGGMGQVLDHAGGHHGGAGGQLAVQADQLFIQQRQGLGHADQYPVERAGGHFAGRHEAHAFAVQPIARQVALQGDMAEVGVAAAGDPGVGREAGRQRTEAVVQDQDACLAADTLLMEMVEQVFVGGIEGLQRIILLLGLANEVELGERRSKYRHKNRRCF